MIVFLKAIAYLFIFVVGTCIGSFLNVLAYRIPKKIDFVRGRSFCPTCKHTLLAGDLVPLFSWMFLRGRCRYCGAGISPRYPLVECAAGLLAVGAVAWFGMTAQAVLAVAVGCVLFTVALIDADTQEIPDGLILALVVLAVIDYCITPELGLLARLIGLTCVSVPMGLINCVIPTSFGGGDLKLMAAMGLLLGWKMTLVGMFFALLLGGGYGVFLLACRRMGRKDHFAFGPFLAVGCMCALFFGHELLLRYLMIFTG
ncbi:MAG: prepilin peptidase [Clostridia bacterium]